MSALTQSSAEEAPGVSYGHIGSSTVAATLKEGELKCKAPEMFLAHVSQMFV